MRNIRQLSAGAKAWWQGLPLSDRRRCVLVSVLVPMAALAAFDARPRTERFEALASGMSILESSAVRGHLNDRHVPYVVLDGGQTVMVPAAKRAELTVELTQMALLRGGLFPRFMPSSLATNEREIREAIPEEGGIPDRAQAHARGASEQ